MKKQRMSDLGLLGYKIITNNRYWSPFRKSDIKSKDFKLSASYLIAHNRILRQIERVLVLPIRKKKDRYITFQFIFGYGDIIKDNTELFVTWDIELGKFIYQPFLIDDTKKNDLSYLKIFEKLDNEKQIGLPPFDWNGKKKIYYAGVEEIKSALKENRGFWSKGALDSYKQKSLSRLSLIIPKIIKNSPNLKYVNVLLFKFKDASLLLLRDIFDVRYKIKVGKHAIGREVFYDPYSAVREFLRTIGLYGETRGGILKRPGRIHADELKEIMKILKSSNIPKEKSKIGFVKEAFIEVSGYAPALATIKKIIKKAKLK